MPRDSESPLSCMSAGLSSTARTMVGIPWRASVAAICRLTTVLPVPLLPAMSVERPSGMPPSVRISRPGTPVGSFFNALMVSLFHVTPAVHADGFTGHEVRLEQEHDGAHDGLGAAPSSERRRRF